MRAAFEHRAPGIHEATCGASGAHVVRAVPGQHPEPKWHTRGLAPQIGHARRSRVRFEHGNTDEAELRPGDRARQSPRARRREIAHSDELEPIEIAGPAEFRMVAALDRAGAAG